MAKIYAKRINWDISRIDPQADRPCRNCNVIWHFYCRS